MRDPSTPPTMPEEHSPAAGTPSGVRWIVRGIWVLMAVALGVLVWHLFFHDTSDGLSAAEYAAAVCEDWEPAGAAMANAWEQEGAGQEAEPTSLALRRSADAAARLEQSLARAGVPQDVAGADDAVLDARRRLRDDADALGDAATAAAAGSARPASIVEDQQPRLDLPLVDGDGPGGLGPAFAEEPRCAGVTVRLASAPGGGQPPSG